LTEGAGAAKVEPLVVAQSEKLLGPGRRDGCVAAELRHSPMEEFCCEVDCAKMSPVEKTSAAQAAQPTMA
jgi:hypothetical protein